MTRDTSRDADDDDEAESADKWETDDRQIEAMTDMQRSGTYMH